MTDNIEARAVIEAEYILENGCTVRSAAKHFGLSKSTVHSDVAYRLKKIDAGLHAEVQKLMDYHFSVRHLRGGEATKIKYGKTK